MIKKLRSIISLTLIPLLFLSGCAPSRKPNLTETRFMLNTLITITIYDKQEQEIMNGAFDLMRRYEDLFSKTVLQSDISRINHAMGQPVEVDLETAELLEESLKYTRLSEGLFDITIGSVSGLWDFTSGEGTVPSPEAIGKALLLVGGKIEIVKEETFARVTVEDGASLDLGAIAKGYIADRITEYLKSRGVNRAIINLGGNLSLIGQRSDKTPFTVGVRNPFGGQGDYIASITGEDISIVSSGSYERFFIQDGVLYHHIINPETGYPAETDLAGITVLCREGARADAMSTILFMLGKEAGYRLASQEPDLEAIFVDQNGEVTYTGGLEGSIKIYK